MRSDGFNNGPGSDGSAGKSVEVSAMLFHIPPRIFQTATVKVQNPVRDRKVEFVSEPWRLPMGYDSDAPNSACVTRR